MNGLTDGDGWVLDGISGCFFMDFGMFFRQMDGLETLKFQSEYELQCNEVLGWRRRAPTVEGFTKEVKKFNQGFFSKLLFFWEFTFGAFNSIVFKMFNVEHL